MAGDIFGIDHLMLSVSDSDLAAEIFARMGFSITPRGQLPGMSNRLICFENADENVPNFIELMSLDDPELAPPPMAKALETPDQPVLIVAASHDAQTTHARLLQGGLEVSPVIDGGRDWTLPDEEVLDLSFSIVLPSAGPAPFYWIACQHKTPQHYLRKSFTSHENGGLELSKIIAVAQDPASAAQHYLAHWGASILSSAKNGACVVSHGRVQLVIHGSASFAKAYPEVELKRSEDHIAGFAIRVGSIASTQQLLLKNGFDPEMSGQDLRLDPAQCCGCLVVFESHPS